MKSWILIIILFAIIGVVLFTNVGWQTMSMVAAGVSGVAKLLLGRLGSGAESIRQKHEEIRAREMEYQQGVSLNVQNQQQQVVDLEHRLGGLDERLAELSTKQERMITEISGMNETELKAAGQHYFGS